MDIQKVSFLDNGGLEVTFDKTTVLEENNREFDSSNKVTINEPRHPDLTKAIDKLKPTLALAYGLTGGILKYKEKIGDKEYEKTRKEILKKIEVIGISIAGKDQLRGVVISGKIESFNKAKIAMNTPRIVYSSEQIGIEQGVENDVNDILAEVEEYLGGKFHQASMEMA